MRNISCNLRCTAVSLFLLLFSGKVFGQSTLSDNQTLLAGGLDHPLNVFADKIGRVFYVTGNTSRRRLFAGLAAGSQIRPVIPL